MLISETEIVTAIFVMKSNLVFCRAGANFASYIDVLLVILMLYDGLKRFEII